MQHIATLDYIGLSILSILSSLSLSFFLSFFLSFIHSLDPSIWKCCLNESNECVLCPQLLHIVWIRLGCCMSCSKENGTRKCGKTWKGIWEFWLDKSRQLGKLIVAAVARRLLLPWPEHCAGVAWSFCWQDRTALGITCKAYFCRNMKNSWQSAWKSTTAATPWVLTKWLYVLSIMRGETMVTCLGRAALTWNLWNHTVETWMRLWHFLRLSFLTGRSSAHWQSCWRAGLPFCPTSAATPGGRGSISTTGCTGTGALASAAGSELVVHGTCMCVLNVRELYFMVPTILNRLSCYEQIEKVFEDACLWCCVKAIQAYQIIDI